MWNLEIHDYTWFVSQTFILYPLKRSTLTWVAFVYPLAVREVSILNSYSVFMSNADSCKRNQVVWLQLTAAYCVICIIIVCSRDIWAQRQDSCVCFSRFEMCGWRHVASLLVKIQEHVFLYCILKLWISKSTVLYFLTVFVSALVPFQSLRGDDEVHPLLCCYSRCK